MIWSSLELDVRCVGQGRVEEVERGGGSWEAALEREGCE